MELFLAYFEEVKELHRRELGHDIEMYKHTEPACLEPVFNRLLSLSLRGTDFLVELFHELAWAQCLGNANHRTTLLFAVDFVESVTGEEAEANRLAAEASEWIYASQAVIRRRGEWGWNQANLEPRHREATQRWIAKTLGQSGALTMIAPNRLLAFLAGSSSSRARPE